MSSATDTTGISGWFATARRSRWLPALAIVAFAVALGLLGLNLYGLTQPVRSPEMATGVPGAMYGPAKTAEEALARLDALPRDDRRAFALNAAEIIGESMSHMSKKQLEQQDADFVHYRYTVPPWENYLLYALRFVKPDTYKMYEYCSWHHALARGVGQCGQISMTVIGYLADQGYNTAFVYLKSHVVASAEVAPGEWYVLDSDFRAYMPHDVQTLASDPALLRTYYNHNDQAMRNLEYMYMSRAPRVQRGTPQVRYQRACVIEQVAHVAKWALPAALIGGGVVLLLLWRRRDNGAAA